jgi:hypothetical protein
MKIITLVVANLVIHTRDAAKVSFIDTFVVALLLLGCRATTPSSPHISPAILSHLSQTASNTACQLRQSSVNALMDVEL